MFVYVCERVSVIKLAIQNEAHRTIVLASPQKNKENEWYSRAHIHYSTVLFFLRQILKNVLAQHKINGEKIEKKTIRNIF